MSASRYNFSGKVGIGVDGTHLAIVNFDSNRISLIIDNEDLFKKVIKKLPVKVRALSIVNKISFIMYKLGLSVELSDSEGALMSMGNGFYSRFRKVHIKLLKVMKYLK